MAATGCRKLVSVAATRLNRAKLKSFGGQYLAAARECRASRGAANWPATNLGLATRRTRRVSLRAAELRRRRQSSSAPAKATRASKWLRCRPSAPPAGGARPQTCCRLRKSCAAVPKEAGGRSASAVACRAPPPPPGDAPPPPAGRQQASPGEQVGAT